MFQCEFLSLLCSFVCVGETLESCGYTCQFDTLSLHDVRTKRTRRFCGSLLSHRTYGCPEGEVDVTFSSDEKNQMRGFRLAYSVVPGIVTK